MSLVNDALRRADEEERQRLAGVTPPGPPATERSPPRRRWLRRLLISACIFLGVAGAAAYGIWWVAGRVIEEATAAVNDLTEQGATAVAASATAALPAAVTVQPQSVQPQSVQPQSVQPDRRAATEGPPASGATPSKPVEPLPPSGSDSRIDPEVVKQIASSLMSQMGLAAGPGAAPKDGGEAEPSPVGDGSTAPEPSGPRTVLKAAEPAPAASGAAPATGASPAGPDNRPKAPASMPQTPKKKDPLSAKAEAKAKTASGKKEPPASSAPKPQTAEKKPAPAALPVDTSHLKVSSIMFGPRGGTAIINGRPVGVGETIGGAKVIKISRRLVEVEIDGRCATLGM